MTETNVVEAGWSEALAAVGSVLDLEASARSSGAVKDGAGLLRLALAYGGCGLSLRQSAAPPAPPALQTDHPSADG